MASGTTFTPVPNLTACLGGAVLLFHSTDRTLKTLFV